VAGSEMSALPTNAAFAAEFARREQRLREQGLVEEVMYCYFSVAIVFGASSLRLWIDGVI